VLLHSPIQASHHHDVILINGEYSIAYVHQIFAQDKVKVSVLVSFFLPFFKLRLLTATPGGPADPAGPGAPVDPYIHSVPDR